MRESGSCHSRQNNSGHDTTDATEAQPQRQATSLGLVVYHLQRVTRDRIALREKILRP